MLRILGNIGSFYLVDCSGLDAVRGIIGREDVLNTHIYVFRDCPIIHSFFIQKPFYATFISNRGILLGQEVMQPWKLSGFYKLSSLCLESKERLVDSNIEEIVKCIDQHKFY